MFNNTKTKFTLLTLILLVLTGCSTERTEIIKEKISNSELTPKTEEIQTETKEQRPEKIVKEEEKAFYKIDDDKEYPYENYDWGQFDERQNNEDFTLEYRENLKEWVEIREDKYQEFVETIENIANYKIEKDPEDFWDNACLGAVDINYVKVNYLNEKAERLKYPIYFTETSGHTSIDTIRKNCGEMIGLGAIFPIKIVFSLISVFSLTSPLSSKKL